jgi:hypothetical protein
MGMTNWEYRVYAAEIVERWSAKKQTEEGPDNRGLSG